MFVIWTSEDPPIFLLEGITRTYKQAPTVSAVLKQTPSAARGIKPRALNVTVGLNCAALLKIHLQHPYSFVFISLFSCPPLTAPDAFDCIRCMFVGKKGKMKVGLLFIEVAFQV